VTLFNCSAPGWQAVDNQVRYQFFTKDSQGGYMMAGPIQSSNTLVNVILPPTNLIVVKVMDKYDQVTELNFAVNITYQSDGSSTSTLD
jgi:hypothetical protein